MNSVVEMSVEGAQWSTPPFDPERYRHHVEGFHLTREQETELLRTLWSIMSTLIEVGFGVDSTQLIIPELLSRTGIAQREDDMDIVGDPDHECGNESE